MIRIIFVALVILPFHSLGQKRYSSEKSFVSFFSEGVIEEIRATNARATSTFDVVTGDIAYLLHPKDFQFEKRLMQVHFNEKYMETEKFPTSSFEGKIMGYDPDKNEAQQVRAVGQLTIHGATNEVDIPGTLQIEKNSISVKSTFVVKLQDFNIKVPQIVWQNIAQQVEVTIEFFYGPITN